MVGRAVRSIAFSFFSNPYLEFCFSTPAFSSILFHKFVQRSKYLTLWKIMEISIDCFGTQDTLKLICLSISQGDLPEHFTSTCCAIMNIQKSSWPDWSSTYRLQFLNRQLLPWEGLNKPKVDPDSSSSSHFTLCPPRQVSSAWFFCELRPNEISIFCLRTLQGFQQVHCSC